MRKDDFLHHVGPLNQGSWIRPLTAFPMTFFLSVFIVQLQWDVAALGERKPNGEWKFRELPVRTAHTRRRQRLRFAVPPPSVKWRRSTKSEAPSGASNPRWPRAHLTCARGLWHFTGALEECCFLNTAEVTRSGVLLWHQCYLAPVVRPEGHFTTVLSRTLLTWRICSGFFRAALLNWWSLGTHIDSHQNRPSVDLIKTWFNWTIPPTTPPFFKENCPGNCEPIKNPFDPPVEYRQPKANALRPSRNRTVGASDWMFGPRDAKPLAMKVSVHYCPLLFVFCAGQKQRSGFFFSFFFYFIFVLCVWGVGI